MIKIISHIKHVRPNGWLSELYTVSDKLFDDFKCVHSYIVNLAPKSVRARHFHKKKTEIITVVMGKVICKLEDIVTKEEQQVILEVSNNSNNHKMLVIPPNVAHVIINPTEKDARIVVFSNSSDLEDTIPYNFGGIL